jgi:hypothetical protein
MSPVGVSASASTIGLLDPAPISTSVDQTSCPRASTAAKIGRVGPSSYAICPATIAPFDAVGNIALRVTTAPGTVSAVFQRGVPDA